MVHLFSYCKRHHLFTRRRVWCYFMSHTEMLFVHDKYISLLPHSVDDSPSHCVLFFNLISWYLVKGYPGVAKKGDEWKKILKNMIECWRTCIILCKPKMPVEDCDCAVHTTTTCPWTQSTYSVHCINIQHKREHVHYMACPRAFCMDYICTSTN